MCFDLCLRAIHDTIETMNCLDYKTLDTDKEANEEFIGTIDELKKIKQKMVKYKGRHSDNSVPCPLCDVYRHHDHIKTEWRSIEDVDRGYERNLLILGEDVPEERLKSIISKELKGKHNLVVTPIKISTQEKNQSIKESIIKEIDS